jgi:predicted nucleotidyltransferase
MNIDELRKRLKEYDGNIEERWLSIYQWGSRVYGTNTERSDWDFLIVVTTEYV